MNDRQHGPGRVARTVVRYVIVHSWGALSRVDEGKKRLASEVLHMLEEGVMRARPKTEELGHVWYQEVAQVGRLITSRHGMGTPGGAHAGRWWPEMTRITDCSAGLGCFEERVGGHEWARARRTAAYGVDTGHEKLALRCERRFFS